MNTDETMPPIEAAKYLGVTRRTLERYVSLGQIIKHEQFAPRKVFFYKSDLDILKEKHPMTSTQIMRLPVMIEHYDKFLKAEGLTPVSEFLEVPSLAPLPKEIAARMQLPEGTLAPRRVLRQGVMIKNKPVYTRISDNYYHPDIVTTSMLVEMQKDPEFNTMQAICEQRGKVVVRFHSDAIARRPNDRERKILNISANTPVMQVIGTNYSEDETVVFVNQRFFVGDYCELSYENTVPYWKEKSA